MCHFNPLAYGAGGAFDYIPTGGDGVYYFATVATDNAGNPEPQPTGDGDASTVYDTDPPDVSVAAEAQGSTIAITWSCTDPSGIAACVLDVQQPDGAWTNLSSETSGTYDYVPDTPGHLYVFRVTAADTAGNQASAEDQAGIKRVTKYYYHGGKRVAMREGDVVYYLHGDHLGSTSLTTDGDGAVVARQLYHPYGEVRWSEGTLPTDFGFTGQRADSYTQLVFMHARYYHPALGRFASADTIVPNPRNPQDFNRYAYVRNSPLNYTDPSGHQGIPEWLEDLLDSLYPEGSHPPDEALSDDEAQTVAEIQAYVQSQLDAVQNGEITDCEALIMIMEFTAESHHRGRFWIGVIIESCGLPK